MPKNRGGLINIGLGLALAFWPSDEGTGAGSGFDDSIPRANNEYSQNGESPASDRVARVTGQFGRRI
jgi:hypothetical protein